MGGNVPDGSVMVRAVEEGTARHKHKSAIAYTGQVKDCLSW
jgi:hypothetical protein